MFKFKNDEALNSCGPQYITSLIDTVHAMCFGEQDDSMKSLCFQFRKATERRSCWMRHSYSCRLLKILKAVIEWELFRERRRAFRLGESGPLHMAEGREKSAYNAFFINDDISRWDFCSESPIFCFDIKICPLTHAHLWSKITQLRNYKINKYDVLYMQYMYEYTKTNSEDHFESHGHSFSFS